MSYKYCEIKNGFEFSELTEREQEYIRKEWERLLARETVNTPEVVFIQKPNGRFFEATRKRHAIVCDGLYRGSRGGYWSIRYGNCKRWGFTKDPFGEFYPEAKAKCFSALILETGEKINIPSSVSAKKDVLELAKKLGFEM